MNFLRIGKTLWAITSHPHIFSSTPQNDLKKIIHQYHDDMYLCQKAKVFRALLTIPISTFPFQRK